MDNNKIYLPVPEEFSIFFPRGDQKKNTKNDLIKIAINPLNEEKRFTIMKNIFEYIINVTAKGDVLKNSFICCL